jgi:hypothetical protein
MEFERISAKRRWKFAQARERQAWSESASALPALDAARKINDISPR